MAARKKNKGLSFSLPLVVISLLLGAGLVLSNNFLKQESQVLSSSVTLTVPYIVDVANEAGSGFTQPNSMNSEVWLGTGGEPSSSYVGFRFQGETIPVGATVESARIEFTAAREQWIGVGVNFKAEKSTSPQPFSDSSKPSSRTLTSASSSFSDNVKWEVGKSYSYDIKAPVQELVNSGATNMISIVGKGTVGTWGRKFIPASNIKLLITYSSSSTPSATPTAKPSITPTLTPKPTATPTPVPTATPTSTPTPAPTQAVTSTPVTGGSGGTIFGLVGADTLGTCSAAVHDKYVTTGPDGKLYRAWHPMKDSSGCTFGHEHGDNPATSKIFTGKDVPFGYIASNIAMDEPHVGFKCFVHNSGVKNDEGSTALHDSYYCFHMGTGGPARFSARFHSLEFHVKTAKGAIMNLQGMADIGNVGTICDNPRQQRTVQGFGCLLDSSYEIWENVLRISNQGQTVGTAITSTAVFDPITSMDPADKTRLVYTWSDEAKSKIFKFGDDRSGYRGCKREAYSGPLNWFNQGGSQVYYTDVYGNAVDGGILRQEISNVNTRFNQGYIDQYGALIMTYKGDRMAEPQSQFKLLRSACEAGLGIKN